MAATYSFLDQQIAFSGPGINVTLTGGGFAEEGITWEMEGDKNAMTIGADGQGMHNLHASEAGTITMRFLKTSPENGILMAAYNAQKASSALWGKNVIVQNDTGRGESYTATQVSFKKKPNITAAMDGGMNEWTFDAVRIEYFMSVAA